MRALGAGIGMYAVSLGVRAAHGIYLLGYPQARRPQGWGGPDEPRELQVGGYRGP